MSKNFGVPNIKYNKIKKIYIFIYICETKKLEGPNKALLLFIKGVLFFKLLECFDLVLSFTSPFEMKSQSSYCMNY